MQTTTSHAPDRRRFRRPIAALLTMLQVLVAAGVIAAGAEPVAAAGPVPFGDGIVYNVSESVAPSGEPAVATELDDTFVAWREGGRIAFTAYRHRGATQDATTTFDVAPGGRTSVAPPGLAAVGDDVWVTWAEEVPRPDDARFRTSEVFVVHSADRGRTFSTPKQLSSPGSGNAHDPKIAATTEVAGVVWDGDEGLELATLERTLGFNIWAVDPLGGNPVNGNYAIAATGDTVHTAWASNGLQYQRAAEGGTRLDPVVQVGAAGRAPWKPRMVALGQDIAIGWVQHSTGPSGAPESHVADSRDNGSTFTDTVVYTIEPDRSGSWGCICDGPLVGLGAGRTIAIYRDTSGAMYQALLENGQLLSTTLVGETKIHATPTDVAVTGAGVFVSYERVKPGTNTLEVQTAARRHGTNGWLLRTAFSRDISWGSTLAPLGDGDYVVALTNYDMVTGNEEVYLAPFAYAGSRDLELIAMSASQGPDDGTSFVTGRKTALRAVVRNSYFHTAGVTLRWTVTDGARVLEFDQRASLRPGTHELWFTPPGDLRPEGNELHVQLVVDPDGEHREDDETNNTAETSRPVVDTDPFHVLYIPLTSDGETVSCEDVQLVAANGEAYLDGTFPIDERESVSIASCTSAVDIEPDTPLGTKRTLAGVTDDVLAQLGHIAPLYGSIVVVTPDGWIPSAVEEIAPDTLGLSDIGIRPGVVLVDRQAYAGWAVAHEIAHDRGWSTNPPGQDHHLPDLPAPGYWVERGKRMLHNDFMHPTGNSGGEVLRWISGETWDHLVGELRAVPGAGLSAAASGSLAVHGVLDEDGAATATVVQSEQAPTVDLGTTAPVEAVLLDAAGGELGRAGLDLSVSSHAGHAGERAFSGRVPEVPGTAAISVRHEGQEVVRRTRSSARPTVELTAPAAGSTAAPGGQIDLAWTASDADDDALEAWIDVTTDGGATWRPVASGVETGTYSAPVTAELTGTLRYRITVSDGWSTASAVSEPIAVEGGTVNGRIAYRGGEAHSQHVAPVLRTVEPDGSDDRLVAELSQDGWANDVRDPAWSPDGRRLVMTESGEELVVVDADGTGLHRLGLQQVFADVDGGRFPHFSCARWSPDGTEIAFVANGPDVGGGPDGTRLWIVDADGTSPRMVLDLSDGGVSCSSWSGSGGFAWTTDDRIWFNTHSAGSRDFVVESIRPDGTGRTVEHTVPRAEEAWYFDVTADGATLAYATSVALDPEIFIAPVGGAPRQLTDFPNDVDVALQPGWLDFSPDGRYLAVEIYDDRRPFPVTVRTVDVLTGALRTVVGGPGEQAVRAPSWQPLPPATGGGSAPTVSATVAVPSGTSEGTPVALDASGSTVDEGPASFAWDLDADGEFDDGTGPSVEVTFSDDGDHPVAVEVTDALGQTDVDRVAVPVANAAPTITSAVAVERSGRVEVQLELDDAGEDDLTVTTTWGDGTSADGATTKGPDGWSSSAIGPVGVGSTVAAEVSDGDGGVATIDVIIEVVANQPPSVAGASGETGAGSPLVLDVVAADPEGDPIELRIHQAPTSGEVEVLGGGGVLGSPTIRYTPAPGTEGVQTFSVVASDGREQSEPATVTVTVLPTTPSTTPPTTAPPTTNPPTTTPPTTAPPTTTPPTTAPPTTNPPPTTAPPRPPIPTPPAPTPPIPTPPAPTPPTPEACPTGAVPTGRFADVGAGNTHRAAVDCLAWRRIAHGRTTTEYEPAGTVTRGQLATFLARLLDGVGAPLPVTAPDAFGDDAGVHAASIDRLAAVGIVGGVAPGRYHPGAPVTRAQMASLLARTWAFAAGRPLPGGPDAFGDDDGDVHEEAIDAVAAAGLAHGVAHARFDPSAPVRRDQMASFLIRMLERMVEAGHADPRS